ncbi:MAG: SpoIIE family protein phosphatase [Chloroflexi bacterium]|nr:SpoIIE family protein phosphatase [Chloroflexota bacterium]
MSVGTTAVIRKTFAGLDKETVQALRVVAERQTYPPKTTLCHQGMIEHTFYLIVSGHVAVAQKMEDGSERILDVLGANVYFGEMGLVDDAPRVADCTTLTETTVLEVTEEIFDQFVEENPVIAYAILRRILSNTRHIDQLNIEELRSKNTALKKAYEELKAAQASIIEKERLEHELALAATMQRSLLPGDLPQFHDYKFAFYLEPARQVGGDFYDVVELDDEHFGVLIADVADKGFHAALFMAVTRTLFLQEGKRSLSPAQVATAVHDGMLAVATTDDTFLTAFYGVVHRPSGKLTYVRAAQDRPLLARPGADVQPLMGNGRFLGMMPDLQLQEAEIQLKSGDRLVLFSDGVIDAVNPFDEHYGNQRLETAVSQGVHLSATAMVDHIIADVDRFQKDAAPFDDLTLLILEVV